MKRILPLLLAVILVLTMCSCAVTKKETPDGAVGVYVAEYVKFFGLKKDVKTAFDSPIIVELKPDNVAVFTFEGQEHTLTWSLKKDNTFRAEGDDIKLTGGVSDGTMVLENMMDSGAYVILTRGAAVPEATPAPEEKALEWWTGDWYGRWQMTDRIGTFADWKTDRWDTLGRVDQTSPGQFSVLLWDEDHPKDSALAEFSMTVKDDGSGNLAAAAGRGTFMTQDLKAGELTVTDQSEYDGVLVIRGSYTVPNGSFAFNVVLRHWGETWDDVAEADRPDNYESWYLPLIESGAKIPYSIDVSGK